MIRVLKESGWEEEVSLSKSGERIGRGLMNDWVRRRQQDECECG